MGQAGLQHLASDQGVACGWIVEPKQGRHHHRLAAAVGRQGQQLGRGVGPLVGHHRGGAA